MLTLFCLEFWKSRIKTERELVRDIQSIITVIDENFPELLKYLDEMPVKVSTALSPGINRMHLKDYFDSLNALVKHYRAHHNPKTHVLNATSGIQSHKKIMATTKKTGAWQDADFSL